MPGLPGSHGIYSLPKDTLTNILYTDTVATALTKAISVLRPGTVTWLIHQPNGLHGPCIRVLVFADEDTYYQCAFSGSSLAWPRPHQDAADFDLRRHMLVLLLDDLFAVECSITDDLTNPDFTRETVRRAMLPALLHQWWAIRIASGLTPRAASFMLSLLLPPSTLAHVGLSRLPDSEDGTDEDDVFWLDPSTRVQVPHGYTLAPPPSSGIPASH